MQTFNKYFNKVVDAPAVSPAEASLASEVAAMLVQWLYDMHLDAQGVLQLHCMTGLAHARHWFLLGLSRCYA